MDIALPGLTNVQRCCRHPTLPSPANVDCWAGFSLRAPAGRAPRILSTANSSLKYLLFFVPFWRSRATRSNTPLPYPSPYLPHFNTALARHGQARETQPVLPHHLRALNACLLVRTPATARGGTVFARQPFFASLPRHLPQTSFLKLHCATQRPHASCYHLVLSGWPLGVPYGTRFDIEHSASL